MPNLQDHLSQARAHLKHTRQLREEAIAGSLAAKAAADAAWDIESNLRSGRGWMTAEEMADLQQAQANYARSASALHDSKSKVKSAD